MTKKVQLTSTDGDWLQISQLKVQKSLRTSSLGPNHWVLDPQLLTVTHCHYLQTPALNYWKSFSLPTQGIYLDRTEGPQLANLWKDKPWKFSFPGYIPYSVKFMLLPTWRDFNCDLWDICNQSQKYYRQKPKTLLIQHCLIIKMNERLLTSYVRRLQARALTHWNSSWGSGEETESSLDLITSCRNKIWILHFLVCFIFST
jgi:hypothetical protein